MPGERETASRVRTAGAPDRSASAQVRAHLEYLRELGVYDFYRRDSDVQLAEPVETARVAESPPAHVVAAAGPPRAMAPASPSARPAVPPAVPPQTLSPDFASELEIPKPPSFNELMPLLPARVAAGNRAAALTSILTEIGDCTRCPLAYAGRRRIVFGDGDAKARLMFIGEGPGADEDEQGLPFVGKSGQLLNNMIVAMGVTREQVYIANIVKCRPPANRAPEPVEANTCTQFLVRQMDVVAPEYVVALGATAAMYLLGVKQSLAALRGRWHDVRGAKAVVTYHPAYLLRDPRQKAEAWKDLQMVMAAMGLKRTGPQG